MASDGSKLPAPVTIATLVATSAKTDERVGRVVGWLAQLGPHPAQLRNDRQPLPGSRSASRYAKPRSRTCVTR